MIESKPSILACSCRLGLYNPDCAQHGMYKTRVAPPLRTPVPTPSPLAVQVGGGHYKDMKIQPIEFIHANNIPFAEGCIIKYVSRWRTKGGIDDLKKARHFLDLLIELETKAGAAVAKGA